MIEQLAPRSIDARFTDADWTKMSWDLPPYKSPAFLSRFRHSSQTLEDFQHLPVFQHAVRNGLIVKDRWMGSKGGYDGRGPQPVFARAVADLDRRLADSRDKLGDQQAVSEVRRWLDGIDENLSLTPLPWAGSVVTADEWFFITTLYVPMNLKGQRTLIRRYFPVFVSEAGRDIRRITPEMVAGWASRFPYARQRLCKMASVLREQGLSMEQCTERLKHLDQGATYENPAPALDAIIQDHQATGWKTLSCFVRDCVQGQCFPIDTRVDTVLKHYGILPQSHKEQLEWQLVNLCRSIGRNPREIARMFYAAADAI